VNGEANTSKEAKADQEKDRDQIGSALYACALRLIFD